jgi:hypothetical protein
MIRAGYYIFSIFLLSSCSVFQKTAKTEFTDGYYSQKVDNHRDKVYVDIDEDILLVYATVEKEGKRIIDTANVQQYFEYEKNYEAKRLTSFRINTFDVDFLTIPLKFRPSQSGVPPQLNTELSGAIYVGLRTDKYIVNYETNKLGKSDRVINHRGFSLGLLTGFGNTFMSPTTTDDNITQEYDGIVWTKGVAGIFAVNALTLGFAIGFDNLLDGNRQYWIYEGKPWLGLTLGLNLN